MIVGFLERLYDFTGIPNANLEEKLLRLLSQRLSDTSPGYQQSLLCSELLHYAVKFTEDTHVNRRVLRFHLNDETRRIKSERTFSSNDVNSAVCSGRRNHGAVLLSLQ